MTPRSTIFLFVISTMTHELRARPAVEIADNRKDATVDSAASDLSKATPLQDVSTTPSDTHARSQLTAIMHVRDTVKTDTTISNEDSCQQPSSTLWEGRTSLRGVDEGSGDHQQLRGIPLTTSAARQGDFHKSTANRFEPCTNH